MPRLSDFQGAIILYRNADVEPTTIVVPAYLEQLHGENYLYLRKIDGSYFAASVVFPDHTVLVAQEVEL
jgi:hypothetical protein